MPSAADTMFLPVLDGDVDVTLGPWLFLGAHAPDKGFPEHRAERLVCEQHLRGPYLDLQMRGADVYYSLPGETSYAGAFVLIGKHRGENEDMVARASSLCGIGSKIVIAGHKTSGIASLKKRIARSFHIEGYRAKYHATVFWLSNNPALSETAEKSTFSMPSGFVTAPGMFSPEKIDKGSSLLAKFIDQSIVGAAADFGAGWGYLSHKIATDSAASSLDLFEAHWPSLEAAKQNLLQIDRLPTAYHWHDITREPILQRFDCVVMNPPFHTGRKTEPALGEKFIEAAASVLKPKGRLLMVANSGLPYEKKLSEKFRRFKELEKSDGFKILLAEK